MPDEINFDKDLERKAPKERCFEKDPKIKTPAEQIVSKKELEKEK